MFLLPERDRVWGWPYHGLCYWSSGSPGGGSYHANPDMPADTPNLNAGGVFRRGDGKAWLIDMGLPAISLTTEEAEEADAAGWQWRNYALISGSYLYGKNIQPDSESGDSRFVYVDSTNTPWLIKLSVSGSGDDATITGTAVLFGEFTHTDTAHTPSALNSVVVTCADITPATSGTFGWSIDDVWVNGAKCLVSIIKKTTRNVGFQYYVPGAGVGVSNKSLTLRDIYSVIEVTVSGDGPGGITLAASEVRGGVAETTGSPVYDEGEPYSSPITVGDVASDCGDGRTYPMGIRDMDPALQLITGREIEEAYARSAFYTASGDPVLMRIRYQETVDTVDSGSTVTRTSTGPCVMNSAYGGSYSIKLSATKYTRWNLAILADDAVVAEFGIESSGIFYTEYVTGWTCSDQDFDDATCEWTNGFSTPSALNSYGATTGEMVGLLEGISSLDAMAGGTNGADYLTDQFRATSHDNAVTRSSDYGGHFGRWMILHSDGSFAGYVGFVHAGGNAFVGVLEYDGAFTATQAYTPAGTLTVPFTLTGWALHFARQPKTGDWSFAESSICYV